MHTTEQLLKISSREFNLPKGKLVTDDFKDAAEKVAWQNKKKRKTFPTLEVVNARTRDSVSVGVNAAELILADMLPITDIGETTAPDGSDARLLMGRLSVLQLRLTEQVGLDPANAAILTPLFGDRTVRTHGALGSYWDDNTFSYGADSKPEGAISLMQNHLIKRYDFPNSIYATAKAHDTYEVVPLKSKWAATAEVKRILAQQGYRLLKDRMVTGMEEDAPSISAVAPAERGLPGPVSIAHNDTYRLAANDALRILQETPDAVFGPQEYIDLSTGETITY